ncbi:Gfo/Idh/MocA family oxidoreductase [Halorubrum sp. 2020YC2]|uniref:Gfo/Idh/MocA family protein n=1 Tax=Halorubrum sp. 2020YC2 TaxID=2836432 RepID=UPI001BE95E5A|nr:Gfo/Idh/MocA family oxidoreductase [Halorubrum sp. 2020YC2]QWC20652.1 Gfo/Idh/MocA family oxidoreductase [Halorubrum sp. 2020YC2]
MTHPNDVAVGIVGLGGIGSHHATKLVERGANLVGGMDIDADARERFHEEFDLPVHADEAALYDDCDAVLVTTPNRFHEEYATAALATGLDVLLEKPLAHTLESAERIAAAARDADGFCTVGFNNRFAEPVRVIKHHQDEGRFGETAHVEANYVRRRGVPGRGSWFTSADVAGGGALIDIGVHAVDLALHFLDHPEVVEVTGETRSEFGGRDDYAYVDMWGDDAGPEGFDVDDSASAFVRTEDGSTVSLEVAWATNRPPTNEFVVRGTEAGATFDRGSGDLTIHEAGVGGGHHLSDATVETREADSHAAEQAAFLEAVAAGEAPQINTVEEGLRVQRVIDAIYRSSETGAAVRLD